MHGTAAGLLVSRRRFPERCRTPVLVRTGGSESGATIRAPDGRPERRQDIDTPLRDNPDTPTGAVARASGSAGGVLGGGT